MRLKNMFQLGIIPVFFFNMHALAYNDPIPDRCPSTNAIQSVGVDSTYQDEDQTWMVGKFNVSYDTKVKWSFAIMDIEANNQDEALDKGRNALLTLNTPKGPIDLRPYMDAWACLYRTEQGYRAAAITPPEPLSFKFEESLNARH